jgi:thymidylate kinase
VPAETPTAVRGCTVAIVGADGAGKSTVIERLLERGGLPARYVYMGASIERANYSLPTSRWLMRRKRRALGDLLDDSDAVPPADIMPTEMRRRLGGGSLIKALGLANRVAEEWYRQMVVWCLALRGYVVLCDRHFLFEYCPDSPARRRPGAPLSVRIHHWLLRHAYPRPTLTIFLDAPPALLYQRKPEWSLAHLERQRSGILEQGLKVRGFTVVDAAQPLATVVAEATALIRRHAARNEGGGARPETQAPR